MTDDGIAGLDQIGIDVRLLATRPQPLTRACLDWSEQAPHLAGGVGAALTAELLRRGWLESREASRVVAVTDEGQTRLGAWLGIDRRSFALPDEVGRRPPERSHGAPRETHLHKKHRDTHIASEGGRLG